jgi:hypothetical protein
MILFSSENGESGFFAIVLPLLPMRLVDLSSSHEDGHWFLFGFPVRVIALAFAFQIHGMQIFGYII